MYGTRVAKKVAQDNSKVVIVLFFKRGGGGGGAAGGGEGIRCRRLYRGNFLG